MTWDPKLYTFLPGYTYDMSYFPRIMHHAWQHYECMPLSEFHPDCKLKTLVTGNYKLFVPYTIVPGVNGSQTLRACWVAVVVR